MFNPKMTLKSNFDLLFLEMLIVNCNYCLFQGETQDCEVPLLLPCPKTCKNLWRSCVDHHSFFSSNRNAKSPKQSNSTVQAYTKLITQHLGLGNSKTET